MLVHIVDTQLVEEFQLWLANAAVLERQAIIRIAPALKKSMQFIIKNTENPPQPII